MLYANANRTSCLLACLLTLAAVAHADSFVLDPMSDSWSDSDDILTDVGSSPGMPTLAVAGSALGLGPQDVINAISDGQDEIDDLPLDVVDSLTRRLGILFSVRRQSLGWSGTGVDVERQADSAPPAGSAPFGHASDIFVSQGAGTNSLVAAPDGWGVDNADEAHAGLVNPANGNPPFPGDDINAYDQRTFRGVRGGLGGSGDGHQVQPEDGEPDDHDDEFDSGNVTLLEPIFFSLKAGSPTLATIGTSQGDILVAGGRWGNTPAIFVDTATLGIPTDAERDALSLLVEENAAGDLVVTKARYSVATSTPNFTLGADVVNSGADVMEFDGATSTLAYNSSDLGLLRDDDIDALEEIVIVNQLAEWAVPVGDAVVEPRGDGFYVTGFDEEGRGGVRVNLPPTLS